MKDHPAPSAAEPSWSRWRIRKDFLLPGNQWVITHNCGHVETVDLGANGHAIAEAERAHERTCGR